MPLLARTVILGISLNTIK